jgi:hypothetical protein
MKKSELQQIIKEEISKVLNEGIFGTSFEKEKANIEKALDRWVAYSMSKGDSEGDVLSVGQQYLRDSIDAYLGGKIKDDDLDNMWDDTMSTM